MRCAGVSVHARVIAAALAGYGAWQAVWLWALRAETEPRLPAVQSPVGWVAVWAAVAVLAAVGAVTGRDLPVRTSFAAMAVASALGAATIILVPIPAWRSFWALSQAILLAVLFLVMLSRPLRPRLGGRAVRWRALSRG